MDGRHDPDAALFAQDNVYFSSVADVERATWSDIVAKARADGWQGRDVLQEFGGGQTLARLVRNSAIPDDFRNSIVTAKGAEWLLLRSVAHVALRLSHNSYKKLKTSILTKRGCNGSRRLQAVRSVMEAAFAGNVPDWLAEMEMLERCGPEYAAVTRIVGDDEFDPLGTISAVAACEGGLNLFVFDGPAEGGSGHEAVVVEGDPGEAGAYVERRLKLEKRSLAKGVINVELKKVITSSFLLSCEVRDLDYAKHCLRILFPITDMNLYLRARLNYGCLIRVIFKLLDDRILDLSHLSSVCTNAAGLGHQAFACLILTLASGAERRNCAVVMLQQGIYRGGMKSVEKRLKEIHTAARRARWLPSYLAGVCTDPSVMLYWNIALGRFYLDYAANDDTVKDRTMYMGEHVAYDAASRMYTSDQHAANMQRFFNARKQDAQKVWSSSEVDTLDSWLLRYVQFGSSGSAGGHSGDEFDIDHAVSKRLWLSNRDTETIAWYVLKQPAGASTVTIVKREAGKLRQLLPGRIPHWIVESLLINEIESAIYRSMPMELELDAQSEYTSVMERRRRMMLGESVACVDWADFNITHTLKDMSEYFLALGEAAQRACVENNFVTYGGVNYGKGEFLSLCANWCSKALYNMWLKNGADKDSDYEAHARGLWSGWRTTSFINCSFNVAYCESNFDSMHHIFNSDMPLYRVHAGDDFFGTYAEEIDAMRFVSSMPLAKHEVNAQKQLVGGEMGEFLRHEYFRDGTVRGSVMRSIGSFVGSDLQAPQLYSGVAQCQGANEAINLLIRRGFDLRAAESIRYTIVQYWGTVKEPGGSSATPSVKLLALSAHSGGLGCPRFGELATVTRERLHGIPVMRDVLSKLAAPRNMERLLHAFQAKIRRFGYIEEGFTALRNAAYNATYGSDLPREIKLEADGELRRAQVAWINECNLKVPEMTVAWYPSVPSKVLEYLERLIACAEKGLEPEYPMHDLNGMAVAARATALGAFSALDSGLNFLGDEAGRVAGFDAVVAMSRGRAGTILNRMRLYLPEIAVRALVEHRWNVPTSTGGVVPAQLRGIVFSGLNYALWYAKNWMPVNAGSLDWLTSYCDAVNIRIANLYKSSLSKMMKM
ncbi:RNA-dependent RNA polymerase [Rosellinia necatrix megabirnavirus 1/W779]|uniref:RNA-directed RNA polymerase n=1 Tax=Rosellinia necatrix megabirnavirus 1 (isolate -/Japan/W779/2001) TaxID=658904 RepID=D0FZL1_RMBV1|nr:RNA-dependent RNA polymerase [Rosellinia necatrix megabirnavirus 1/W779]BAI48016.1 RNA-dependent RNA polymerase [Rosellinia necatrix megabirnavirus 1/W779]